MFQQESILVTGGTGSFGNALVRRLLQTEAKRIVVFSRDELKQSEMRSRLPKDERLRFFLGDVRDVSRLDLALHGIDVVVHAAALKQVDTGEYNPIEFIKTNVLGSQNLIESSVRQNVKKVIALSTDKASSPINLYGATKLTSDKLFIAANNFSNSRETKFSVVRYGNVVGSRGSVIPLFTRLIAEKKPLPITDKRMTRFWITLDEATSFVINSVLSMRGGELFVPKIPSIRVVDLIEAFMPNSGTVEVGIRPGEKLHEEMISSEDSRRTTEQVNRYVINPTHAEWGYIPHEGLPMTDGVSYRSDNNTRWLSVPELRTFLNQQKVGQSD
jgi:UDP-N-acetylglucosamine 4,6-dehydratase